MPDPNQKLFSQISDLSRNVGILTDAIKKSTQSTEELQKKLDSAKEGKTGSQNADRKYSEIFNVFGNTVKDLGKMVQDTKKSFAEKEEVSKKENPLDFKKMAESAISKVIGGNLPKIKGSFQNGGIVKETGEYIVGENGPEILKLPKGSGIVPINVKDMIEGLSKIPELGQLVKNRDSIDFLGSSDNITFMSKDRKISLDKMIESYDDMLIDAESKKDEASSKMYNTALSVLNNLYDKATTGIEEKIGNYRTETSANLSKLNPKGDESLDSYKNRDRLVDQILSDFRKDQGNINDLSVSSAYALATKFLLDKKEKEKTALTESVVSPKTLTPKPTLPEENSAAPKASPVSSGLGKKIDSLKEGISEKSPAIINKAAGLATKLLGTKSEQISEKLGIGKGIVDLGIEKGSKLSSAGLKKIFGEKQQLEKKEQSDFKIESPTMESKPSNVSPVIKNTVNKLSPTKSAETIKQSQENLSKSESSKATGISDGLSGTASSDVTKSNETSKSGNLKGSQSQLGPSDLDDIKNALSRIASILEGTLTVMPLDIPFRPDSRRV